MINAKNLCEITKDPKQPKQSWNNKNKAAGITLPDFKLYYKTIVIKTCGTALKTHRLMERIKGPEINPCIY